LNLSTGQIRGIVGGVVGGIGLTVLIGFVILAQFLVVFLVFKQKVRGGVE